MLTLAAMTKYMCHAASTQGYHVVQLGPTLFAFQDLHEQPAVNS